MCVCLIGYRGTGKTSVARHLAARLGWPWIDADAELERRAGRSIAEIFSHSGEPAFRKLESQVLADLVAVPHRVVALGGGVVLSEANRRQLAQVAAVAWLQGRPELLWQRILADETTAARRPNLTAGGGLPEIEQLLARREPLYRECATCAVDTENKSPVEVAEEIFRKLGPLPWPLARNRL